MKGSIHDATGEVERVQKLNFKKFFFTVEGERGGSFFFFFFPKMYGKVEGGGGKGYREMGSGKCFFHCGVAREGFTRGFFFFPNSLWDGGLGCIGGKGARRFFFILLRGEGGGG